MDIIVLMSSIETAGYIMVLWISVRYIESTPSTDRVWIKYRYTIYTQRFLICTHFPLATICSTYLLHTKLNEIKQNINNCNAILS